MINYAAPPKEAPEALGTRVDRVHLCVCLYLLNDWPQQTRLLKAFGSYLSGESTKWNKQGHAS